MGITINTYVRNTWYAEYAENRPFTPVTLDAQNNSLKHIWKWGGILRLTSVTLLNLAFLSSDALNKIKCTPGVVKHRDSLKLQMQVGHDHL